MHDLGRQPVIGHPALTDEATGLANRLHFELVYGYLFHGADRGVPLTVMLLEAPGTDDAALPEIGARLQRTTRASDLVSYLGDGRFAVLLLGTNMAGARVAADRVEEALQGTHGGRLSVALAAYQADMKEPWELLQAVDRALEDVSKTGGGLEMVSD